MRGLLLPVLADEAPVGVQPEIRSGIKMGAEIAFLFLYLSFPPMTETELSDWHLNCLQSMETR